MKKKTNNYKTSVFITPLGISSIAYDFSGSKGKVAWTGNWVSYIDTLLQFELISIKTRELRLPTYVKEIVIDPVYHKEVIGKSSNTKGN